jgi:hypothetical protein
MAIAEEITLESVPELMHGAQASTQGGSISILGEYANHSTDPCRLMVFNCNTGQSVRFDTGLWSAPAIFFDEGRKFLTATYEILVFGGPTNYTIYDMDCNASYQLTTNGRIAPSESGRYFCNVSGSRPIIYNFDFSILKEFKANEDISSGWDATFIGDSIYILCDRYVFQMYHLPDLKIIKEFYIEPGPGIPMRLLYCEDNGKFCALSSRYGLRIINTVTGNFQSIAFELVSKIHVSSDGNRVYSIGGRRDYMIIYQYDFDGTSFSNTRLDTVVYAEYLPGPIKAKPESIIELPDGIAINLKRLHGEDPKTSRRSVGTVFTSHQENPSNSVQYKFTDGLTWLDNSGATPIIRNFTYLSSSKALIKEINSYGEVLIDK